MSRLAVASIFLPSNALRTLRNRPYFVVDISTRKGLGAVLAEALLLCSCAEARGWKPVIRSTNPLYSPGGRDFLAEFFANNSTGSDSLLLPIKYRTLETLYFLGVPSGISIADAAALLKRFWTPTELLTRSLDAVREGMSGERLDLSIHYRGTDKLLEAPTIRFEAYADAIQRLMGLGHRIQRVFLATDEPEFECFIRARFSSVTFYTYNLGCPTVLSRGRHFSDLPALDKAKEALVNMYLLADAPICVRGASYLSAMSTVINPDLRTITLNRTHDGSREFPEAQVLLQEAVRPVLT